MPKQQCVLVVYLTWILMSVCLFSCSPVSSFDPFLESKLSLYYIFSIRTIFRSAEEKLSFFPRLSWISHLSLYCFCNSGAWLKWRPTSNLSTATSSASYRPSTITRRVTLIQGFEKFKQIYSRRSHFKTWNPNFFLFLWAIFALLDPDLDSESGSGSTTLSIWSLSTQVSPFIFVSTAVDLHIVTATRIFSITMGRPLIVVRVLPI